MCGYNKMNQREEILTSIRKELEQARAALAAGRDGRSRVNARRAVGLALKLSDRAGEKKGFGRNAVSDLRRLVMDETNPHEVRLLAMKLVARENDPVERTTNPPDDALRLILWLLPDFPAGSSPEDRA